MATPSASLLLITAPQLGQLLVSARKRRKLTQDTVAIRLNLSQNRISHLEHHPEEISFKQLLSWCAILELDLRLGNRVVTPADSGSEW